MNLLSTGHPYSLNHFEFLLSTIRQPCDRKFRQHSCHQHSQHYMPLQITATYTNMHLKHQGKCHIKIDKNSHSNKDLPHESASVFHTTTKLGSPPMLHVRASLQQVFFLALLSKDFRVCPFAEQTLNPPHME